MAMEDTHERDPFADPSRDEHHFDEQATLNVGRNASLTLGTDSLVVLGTVYDYTPEPWC